MSIRFKISFIPDSARAILKDFDCEADRSLLQFAQALIEKGGGIRPCEALATADAMSSIAAGQVLNPAWLLSQPAEEYGKMRIECLFVYPTDIEPLLDFPRQCIADGSLEEAFFMSRRKPAIIETRYYEDDV